MIPGRARPRLHVFLLVAALGIAGLPGLARPVSAGTRSPQQGPASIGRASVKDLGGFSGVVPTPSATKNLCVVARSADGRSPAVRSRTFELPGFGLALFSIGALPGTGVPAGTWNLRAGPCDGSTTTPATPRFTLDDVRVDGGVVTAGLLLLAEQDADSASVDGTVVDDKGDPVEGACVSAVGTDPGTTGGSARTGEEGEYRISGLAPGGYRVLAVGCGDEGTDLRGAATDKGKGGKPRTVEATADGAKGITVTMSTGRRITGKLVDSQGGAITGACVQAGDRQAVTKTSGTFVIRGVADGVASLAVTSCGDGQGVVGDRLAIAGDTDEPAVDLGALEVRRAGTVEGTVNDGDGLSASGILITARRTADGPDVGTAVTDGSGRYRLTGIAPGKYVLIVNPGGAEGLPTAWSTTEDVTGSVDAAAPRTVGADAPVTLSVTLGDATPTTEVSIAVAPVDNASITVDGIRRADGTTTLPLGPGDHLVEFGDVTGWATPDNDAIKVDEESDSAQEISGVYDGPLVRIRAEVPEGSVPVTVNGRPVGSGLVSVVVPPDEEVRVCSGNEQCLPVARAADLVGQVLRPPAVDAPTGPSVRVVALGAGSTLLDAEVSLDGELRAIGQVILPVDAGPHDVLFGDVPGYLTPLPHSLEIRATNEVPVVARYQRLAPTTIDAGTEEGTVWVDGSPVGTGAISIGLRPGTRRVCADLGREVGCTEVEASEGDSVHLDSGRFTS